MINTFFPNWSLIRGIRLIIGVLIIIQSIEVRNYLLLLPGFIFAIMALLNLGCGSHGCSIIYKNKKDE